MSESIFVNVALGAIYALTVVAGAIGEWSHYVLGGVIEVVLLASIVYHAWTWPTLAAPVSNLGLKARSTTFGPPAFSKSDREMRDEGQSH